MRLSKKSEYAFPALLELTRNYNQGLVKIEDLAKKNKIPKKYLEQILLLLKTTGYLKSKRGMDGGYKLSKPPAEITVAEIIRLIDGALAPVESVSVYFYEPTPIEQSQALIKLFRDIRDYTANKLETTTFADLVDEEA